MPNRSPQLPRMLMGLGFLPRPRRDRQAGHNLHRTVLTTKDKQKVLDMAKEIGDKVRVEEIAPKPKKH